MHKTQEALNGELLEWGSSTKNKGQALPQSHYYSHTLEEWVQLLQYLLEHMPPTTRLGIKVRSSSDPYVFSRPILELV